MADSTRAGDEAVRAVMKAAEERLAAEPLRPVRQKSALGLPKPTTSIERTCRRCGASFWRVEFKSEDGACTNEAESFFSRLRRSEMGIHHRISGKLLAAYAHECSWREDNRRVSNGTQWKWITAAALAHPKSKRWAGYWHRSAA